MLKNRLNILKNLLLKYKRVLIAYSGGVDSSFLLYFAAKTLGPGNVLAVTALSETYPSNELKLSRSFSNKLKIKHVIIKTRELQNDRFSKNPFNRCFYCKDELFRKLSFIAKKQKMVLCDATNYSDLKDYRPGQKAVKKWNVKSPLKSSGFLKKDIRKYSKECGLSTWNLPAQACLASRIPYHTKITAKTLKRIEAAENFLKKLGFMNLRVRHHGDIARIELGKTEIRDIFRNKNIQKISACLKNLGWHYIAVDIDGYRTGSLNIF
ncbi:MAG: ATP-dependent sacrificial sulfur transferase LarE [Elusimicrobia bacterium]|nr:ATP-dependent sacrificial sulfur transferase LarE [Candidatus Liberimonas magnetica]